MPPKPWERQDSSATVVNEEITPTPANNIPDIPDRMNAGTLLSIYQVHLDVV